MTHYLHTICFQVSLFLRTEENKNKVRDKRNLAKISVVVTSLQILQYFKNKVKIAKI